MDNLKDEYIREKFHEDKEMSSKANHVFENFKMKSADEIIKQDKEKVNIQGTKYRNMNKYLAYAASFLFVILIGTGTILYKQTNNQSGTNIVVNKAIIKNSEVLDNKEQPIKECENNYFIVELLKDNVVTISLKESAITKYNVNTTTNKSYKVSEINNVIEDIYIGSIGSEDNQYVILLMQDGSVEYVDILGSYSQNNEFNFVNKGLICGIYNVKGFEQKSENGRYYIDTIRKKEDNIRQKIILNKDNQIQQSTTEIVKFTSQDGNKVYTIEVKSGDYIQAHGWAGASNNVYYISDNCLYHMSLVDGNRTKLITGVNAISYDSATEKINVEFSNQYTINKEDPYLNIGVKQDTKPEQKEEKVEQSSNEIQYKIINEYGDADKSKIITGKDFSVLPGGSARSYVYYISGTDLYEVQLVNDFPTRKIAEGIENLTIQNDEQIIAKKGTNSKELIKINYIIYK